MRMQWIPGLPPPQKKAWGRGYCYACFRAPASCYHAPASHCYTPASHCYTPASHCHTSRCHTYPTPANRCYAPASHCHAYPTPATPSHCHAYPFSTAVPTATATRFQLHSAAATFYHLVLDCELQPQDSSFSQPLLPLQQIQQHCSFSVPPPAIRSSPPDYMQSSSSHPGDCTFLLDDEVLSIISDQTGIQYPKTPPHKY